MDCKEEIKVNLAASERRDREREEKLIDSEEILKEHLTRTEDRGRGKPSFLYDKMDKFEKIIERTNSENSSALDDENNENDEGFKMSRPIKHFDCSNSTKPDSKPLYKPRVFNKVFKSSSRMNEKGFSQGTTSPAESLDSYTIKNKTQLFK